MPSIYEVKDQIQLRLGLWVTESKNVRRQNEWASSMHKYWYIPINHSPKDYQLSPEPTASVTTGRSQPKNKWLEVEDET